MAFFQMDPSTTVVEPDHLEPYFASHHESVSIRDIFEKAFLQWSPETIKLIKDYVDIKYAQQQAQSKQELAASLNLGRTALFYKEKKLQGFSQKFDQMLKQLEDGLSDL